MSKITPDVRYLVGLENLLRKARRRLRESERGEGGVAARYEELIARLTHEMHTAEARHLQEYLQYVEETVIPRITRHAEEAKSGMLAAAGRIVDGKAALAELKGEYTDALDRVRAMREKLKLDPFPPTEARFGLEPHAAGTDRRLRDAHILVREFLKS
ncbi:MAG: hypothetical protein ACT4PV_02075 [Planctomycetaceae bacterium]